MKQQVGKQMVYPEYLNTKRTIVILNCSTTGFFFCFWFFYPPYPAPPPFQVCPSVFEVPASYHRRGGSRHMPVSNNDEELLQYAIHQSLLESRQGTGQVRAIVTDTNFFFMQISPPPPHMLKTVTSPGVCRRGSGIMLMGTSLM